MDDFDTEIQCEEYYVEEWEDWDYSIPEKVVYRDDTFTIDDDIPY